ncbi:tRNA (N6-threonylcarbamoyladenosine(37)-N6)-methyltransferase TrmO [Orbaceae bacterium ac157xtp]
MEINTIGYIRTPYKEKFGVPRQPNLVPQGKGELHLISPFNQPDFVRGIEQFSHLWLLFIFSQTKDKKWHPTVRPPRLGGNERIGVFASRSTFRPNSIGLSAVELHDVFINKNEIILKLGSVDLVDMTPIIDIKPYIPYSDSYPNASAGYAQDAPLATLNVQFSETANAKLTCEPTLKQLIIEVIAQDPRPAYKKDKNDNSIFGIQLSNLNVRWSVNNQTATIVDVENI